VRCLRQRSAAHDSAANTGVASPISSALPVNALLMNWPPTWATP
jgi:hypothetical protein